MSYDIYLRGVVCEHCGVEGPHPENLPDPTYNLTPIFDLALTGEKLPNLEVTEAAVVLLREKTDRPRGLRLLNGKKAKDTLPMLTLALARLSDPSTRQQFVVLEPENKWGTMQDAISIFEKLVEYARYFPECTWEVH